VIDVRNRQRPLEPAFEGRPRRRRRNRHREREGGEDERAEAMRGDSVHSKDESRLGQR
jgi:hypothetical protein